MENWIKIIYKIIILNTNSIKWYFQYKKNNHANINAEILKINDYEKILIIVPHADDELIGTHMLISKYSSKIELLYCGMTGENNNKSNYNIRLKEFKEYCKINKVDYKIAKNDNIESSIKNSINRFNPNYIFIPSFFDWHEEHLMISKILTKINLENIKIGLFQISVPIPVNLINYYLTINRKGRKNKWSNFKNIYKSQSNLPIKRFKYNEMVNKVRGYHSSEVYAIMEYEEYKKIHNNNINNINKNKIVIRDTINNIYKIRILIDSMLKNNK